MLYNNSGFLYNYTMTIEKGIEMRGSIRMFIGFFLLWGAAGALDFPENSLLTCVSIAVLGALIGLSGVNAMRKSQ
mgnify:CR=1 FL=1